MYYVAGSDKFGGKKCKKETNEIRRNQLLARAFALPVTDMLMVPHLRQVEFVLARKILTTLFDLIENENDNFEQVTIL